MFIITWTDNIQYQSEFVDTDNMIVSSKVIHSCPNNGNFDGRKKTNSWRKPQTFCKSLTYFINNIQDNIIC